MTLCRLSFRPGHPVRSRLQDPERRREWDAGQREWVFLLTRAKICIHKPPSHVKDVSGWPCDAAAPQKHGERPCQEGTERPPVHWVTVCPPAKSGHNGSNHITPHNGCPHYIMTCPTAISAYCNVITTVCVCVCHLLPIWCPCSDSFKSIKSDYWRWFHVLSCLTSLLTRWRVCAHIVTIKNRVSDAIFSY